MLPLPRRKRAADERKTKNKKGNKKQKTKKKGPKNYEKVSFRSPRIGNYSCHLHHCLRRQRDPYHHRF